MPTYIYKAKDGPTRTVEGTLLAESRAAALLRIDELGYSPVWVREGVPEARGPRRRKLTSRRVSSRDVTLFTRQLASLTRAGVPILRSLSTIAGQLENPRLGRIVEDIEATIRDGNMLSDGLAKYPRLFPELYVNMVRSGESGGILEAILTKLGDARERDEELRRKVQAAAAYPLLVVVVGVATVFILLTFFLPRVLELFKGYAHLPLITRILIGTTDFFSANWYWLVLMGLLLWAILKRLAAAEKGRSVFDAAKLRLPGVGRFLKEADIARFTRTLALLIQAGIPIDRALALAADTLRNVVLREEMYAIRRSTVQQGEPLSEGLKRSAWIPPLVANMVAVGEQGGRLDETLAEAALFYESEVDQHCRMAVSLLEPILILVVGGVVGFIVSAMLLPIFELSTSVR